MSTVQISNSYMNLAIKSPRKKNRSFSSADSNSWPALSASISQSQSLSPVSTELQKLNVQDCKQILILLINIHHFAAKSQVLSGTHMSRALFSHCQDPFQVSRPNLHEPGNHLNHGWNNQQSYGSNKIILGQQGVGPRAFVRPPFLGPAPGFIAGPMYPGAPGPMYYLPAAQPGCIRMPQPPFFVAHPKSGTSTVSPISPESDSLQSNITKQIEYYFSDENLQTDNYLLSLIDAQGWVPISIIADFKRVKRMSTDIHFILDALQNSSAVEVQNEKVRRRDEWSKWVPASASKNEATDTQEQHVKKVVSDTKNNEVSEVMEVKTFEDSQNKSVNHNSLLGIPKPDIDKTKLVDSNVENERRKGVVRTEGTSKGTRGPKNQSNSNSRVKFPHNVHTSGSVGVPLKHQCLNGNESKSTRVQEDNTAQIRDRPCNDFSGTFMFDEDIELEFKEAKAHSSSLPKRSRLQILNLGTLRIDIRLLSCYSLIILLKFLHNQTMPYQDYAWPAVNP
ncbi:HTH La-type RNA-binding domain-containing protein [Heracleum sosnowskyi]|uniref:HTH La-type RNA-binding domain-containing protein n=1 Tax=Heracleum sosnowskyi TaxID=360622 RepID=A0AAD8MEU0_9APIA|nr:HTH La-type RNA-binding domain-containing protein [Heracleum sosnowskyi]